MAEYLLGIDIGTSACKIAIFDKKGEVIASENGEYPVYYPKKGWAEQNPNEWWNAVGETTKRAIQKSGIKAEKIVGVGIDGQSWSAIAVDKAGKVLCNTPIWMDTRAKEICERLNKKIGSKAIFDLAGNSLQPSYTTAKIIWYKENLPDIYNKIDKILQSNGFIAYCLTNVISIDKSQGYGLHCFDMRKGLWNDEMCEALGIERSMLPDIYECDQIVGKVTKVAAEFTGIPEGTPVVAGGLDAACGTLGAGVIHAGETQEQGGQAGGMSISIKEYKANPLLILSYHVVPNQWLLQGGTTGGGGVMRWFEREFADYERVMSKENGKDSLIQLNEIAKKVLPGSDGLVFLPYMAGERSPIWDPNAKGVFFGLDFSKTKGHMLRAAMEGVAFSLKHNLDVAKEVGVNVETLYAIGGSANSLLWTQIKADITGKKIKVPASDTATTLGAALLAGIGVGLYKNYEEAVAITVQIKREHKPNAAYKDAYDKNYEIYLELYKQLKNVMKKSGGK